MAILSWDSADFLNSAELVETWPSIYDSNIIFVEINGFPKCHKNNLQQRGHGPIHDAFFDPELRRGRRRGSRPHGWPWGPPAKCGWLIFSSKIGVQWHPKFTGHLNLQGL